MKEMIRLASCLLICTLLYGIALSQGIGGDIKHLLDEKFESDGPGYAILVAKGDSVIYREAGGLANLESGLPMRPDHIFRIGSITKQFTASAILLLAEDGKLSLDDPLSKYVPDFKPNASEITITQLLNHTSGVKSYTGMVKWTPEVHRQDFTPKDMIKWFSGAEPDFAPGEAYAYNNSAYFLLGYIIEKASGKSYEKFIEKNLFEPFGMKDSRYGHHWEIVPERASGYSQMGDLYMNAPYLSMTQPYAAGSLLSTVDDIWTWYRAVMAGKVISDKSRTLAHTKGKLNNGEEIGYGFGWALGELEGKKTIGHGGGIHGYLTSSIYLPEEDLFIALFSNCTCNTTDDVAENILKLLF